MLTRNHKKVLSVALLFCLSCTSARFTRTQNIRSSLVKSPDDVALFIDQKPTRSYAEVGMFEAQSASVFSVASKAFNKIKKKAFKEGVDGVMIVDSSKSIDIGASTDIKMLDVHPRTYYYGKAIVFVNDPNLAGTTISDAAMKEMSQKTPSGFITPEGGHISIPLPNK